MSVLRNRGVRSGRLERGEVHGVVVLVRTLLLFESAMYSVVTPVLAHYQHVLHASKPAIGVLAGSYAAGLIPGSLLAAVLATRVGVRRATVFGLVGFAAAVFAFGFASETVTLDALRFLQGVACGFIWAGLAWVISVAPREGRGEIIGTVFAAAIFGTLLGPVLGTLAVAVGTELVFTLVTAVALVLAAWSARFPDPPAAAARARTPITVLVSNRRIMLGVWLILLEAITVGATNTLLPLRLSRFGASGVAIGGVFLLAALISTCLATPFGRVVDRLGSGVLLRFGLSTTAVLFVILPIPQSVVPLAIVSVIALGGPLTASAIPAMAIMTDAAEHAAVPVVVATMLLNLAWATGETLGAPAAAGISQATSDAVVLVMLAGLTVLTLVPVLRARLRPSHFHARVDATELEPLAVRS